MVDRADWTGGIYLVGADLAYAPASGGSYRSAKLCRFPASGSGSSTIAVVIAAEVASSSVPVEF
jgi:hypothetical protein